MNSYKEEHQSFVSGHSGTSFDQLALIFSSVCASCSLKDGILVWMQRCNQPIGIGLRLLLDFVALAFYSLLNITLLSDHIFLSFICAILVIALLFYSCIYTRKPKYHQSSILCNINLGERKTFVTQFRSIVTLFTALAILAVDFQVFPRKFAKTEEFGYGMMDFGVGFFVISNAIVAPEVRRKESQLSKIRQMRKAFVSSLPLLVLGFARFITVKGTDYHEHVTEYGVHWNFFFTLAALKVFSASLFCALPNTKPGITGLLLLLVHQYLLSSGLSDYIIFGADGKGGRGSLIDANREGIFSLPGYIALYMMGVQLGRFIFQKRSNLSEWLRVALCLFLVVVGITFIVFGLDSSVQLVSRRFANAAFVLSTMSFSCIALTICLLGDIMKTYAFACGTSFKKGNNSETIDQVTDEENKKLKNIVQAKTLKEPCLLEAISFNSLFFFLLANLMTGLVNVSMSTIHANTLTAMIVLTTYSLLLCFITVMLYLKDIKTKIW